ncbi:hypothetical protein NKG94_22430 [Micromonospora sp. M12]
MVAGPGGQLYIIFSKGSAGDPVLSRWVRDGSAWDGASWTCTGAPISMPELGHGNDLAYNPNYLGSGPALIATQGSQSAFPSDDVTIVHLNANGSVGARRWSVCRSATSVASATARRRPAALESMRPGGWAPCGLMPVPVR